MTLFAEDGMLQFRAESGETTVIGDGKPCTDYEKVNHPTHYNLHPSGVECIDIIEHFPHNIGAAMKYMWRAGLKPGEGATEDLKKALWFLEREIARLEGRVPEYIRSPRNEAL